MKIQNKLQNLHDETEGDKEEANDQLKKIVMEAALEVGGKAPNSCDIKLTKETKDPIKKCIEMKVLYKLEGRRKSWQN